MFTCAWSFGMFSLPTIWSLGGVIHTLQLNFSPLLKHMCLHQVPESLLHHQIDEGPWGHNEICHEMGQLAYLFFTQLTQTTTECHYRVAVVWWHPAQSKVNINSAFEELENHDLHDKCLQYWCWYLAMSPSRFSQMHPL